MQVGDTVSLRVRTPRGPTDLVGTLIATTPDVLTVRRRDGEIVEVDVSTVAAGRVVPPGPAQRIGAEELERVVALGWRPLESAQLGGWLLRASGGFTRRGNSALALGDPGVAPSEALARLTAWYAERHLPPRIALVPDAAPPGLAGLLDNLGWEVERPTRTWTADLGPVLRAAAGPAATAAPVQVDDDIDDAWLDRFRADEPAARSTAARTLLRSHDDVVFVSVRDGERCLAVARIAVDGRWCGLSCVEVDPDHRRGGLATAVSAAAFRWAAQRGARRAYLQVVDDNAVAQSLFAKLGFRDHHGYVYRVGSVVG